MKDLFVIPFFDKVILLIFEISIFKDWVIISIIVDFKLDEFASRFLKSSKVFISVQ